jgi:ABC-type branched-subunit amino acid transport system permease subunit
MADVEVKHVVSRWQPPPFFQSRRTLTLAVVVAVGVFFPFVVPSSYWLGLLALAWIYALGAESVNLIGGYLGELPLSTQAFFAVGAYASALIFPTDGSKAFVAIAIAAVGCGVAGAALAPIVCRVTGTYFSVMTLAIAGVVEVLLGNLSITGGANGLSVPTPVLSIGGTQYVLSSARSYYYVGLAALIVIGLLVTLLLRSRWGRGAVAIRDNPELAVSVGVNAFRVRAIMFAASSAIAGLSGALYAHYVLYFSDVLSDALPDHGRVRWYGPPFLTGDRSALLHGGAATGECLGGGAGADFRACSPGGSDCLAGRRGQPHGRADRTIPAAGEIPA